MAAACSSVNSQNSANFFQSLRLRCLYARSHIISRIGFVSGEWSNLNVSGDSLWRLSIASVLVWKINQITSSSEKGQIRQKPGAEISTGIFTAQWILCSLLFRMIIFDICNPCANKCAVVTFLNWIIHVLILHYTPCTRFNRTWQEVISGRDVWWEENVLPTPLQNTIPFISRSALTHIGNLNAYHLKIVLPSEISLSFDDHIHNNHHISPHRHSKSWFILLWKKIRSTKITSPKLPISLRSFKSVIRQCKMSDTVCHPVLNLQIHPSFQNHLHHIHLPHLSGDMEGSLPHLSVVNE